MAFSRAAPLGLKVTDRQTNRQTNRQTERGSLARDQVVARELLVLMKV